ncbi:S-layer homology domain-containing protein [Paenibacillus sp. N3/727]|uniref:S-layer homology domain-containing protein n=1 Tax=Paenibacillus sp. N3/727 TaxID=2925845 RepID=UPI001F5394FD|nr:S-layer homology domain-containing protein [Paenibacillus sp. N3/727]UNK19960.1 S-layer homology domain-containing protein [Paenibacillus sp. N3/727]
MNKNFRRRLASLLSLTLILSLVTPWGSGVSAQTSETPQPESVSLVSQDGQQQLMLTDINADENILAQKSDYLAVFTSGARVTDDVYDEQVFIKTHDVAIVVDASGIVQKKYGPDGDPPTAWDPDEEVMIPEGGYIVLAGGSSWDASVHQKPLFLHYGVGDKIKLMRGEREVTAGDFLKPSPEPEPEPNPEPGTKPELVVNTPSETIVTIPLVEVSGYVKNYTEENGMKITINDKITPIAAGGSFRMNVYLNPGPNPITVRLLDNQGELATVSLNAVYDTSEQTEDYIEVEAAPADITIGVQGPRKRLSYIDKDVSGIENIIALFTGDFGASIVVPKFNVAVQVDVNNRVLQVINPSVNGKPPVWAGPTELAIPEGGYVLMAQDNSYAGNDIKRFLAEKFKAGDMIKLRKNGEVVSVKDLMSGNGWIAKLVLDNAPMYTVIESQTSLTGRIENMDDPSVIRLMVNDTEVPFGEDGTFTYSYSLQAGTNYIDVKVLKNSTEQDKRSIVVFNRPGFTSDKEVILWVDQAANAKKFKTSENVREFLEQAKNGGTTAVVFDVKGVEGYASYKKNDLTGRPYVSEIKAPQKAGASPDLDLLQEFITHGHALGLKIHAAINVFAEGSIAHQEFAVLNDHLDWEERVHFAENNGEIKRLRESAKQGLVAFVNPSNDEVREYELKTFKEIIKNYDVDGVVHDRGRYDNEGADFSNETRVKFEQFLSARGKQLVNWPNDVFYYENNVRVNGPLIQDWWEFRSGTIQSFFGEVKAMVDSYEAESGREIKVSSYVGSWYETYFLNGVNWGSKNFRFDSRLGLLDESVYTPEYYETGYIEYLDFLMIGAYQTTSQEVKKYITLGNIVTNGEIPLYAGIALTNVQTPAMQREVFQAGLSTTNGLMLFDASQVNWPIVSAALQDREWVKDYQLGTSLPGNPTGFMEGNFYNVNRVEGNINVMTEEFGYSTGTNRFGVEVVVNASGEVTHVVNRDQAIRWSWGSPEENNSVIPPGGFVISTVDPSGIRINRQLVANAYNKGDQVRSAVLSGLLDDEGKQTANSSVTVEGHVKVLGPGNVSVQFNGQPATVKANGDFTASIPLSTGSNRITFDVYVDQLKTNSKSLDIVRTSNGGETGPENPGNPGNPGSPVSSTTPSVPTSPAAPERLKVKQETGRDGRTVTRADVNLELMLKEIEQLVKGEASSRKLQYTLKDKGDVVEINLPVSGLITAVKKLSAGEIVIDTPYGHLQIPLSSLQKAVLVGKDTKMLMVRIRKLEDQQEKRLAARLALEGTSKLGQTVDLELVFKQEEAELKFPGFSGGYAKFAMNLPDGSDLSRISAFKYDLASDRTTFVPSRINTKEGQSYAELILSDGGILSIGTREKSFNDLSGHWAQKDIMLLASRGLIEGVDSVRFAPNKPVTRAEFTSLLVRSLGLKKQSDSGVSFNDVHKEDWFADAIETAAGLGLIEGFVNGEFRPNEQITREQMSALLVRALKMAGKELDTTGAKETLRGFEDAEGIGAWSETAVAAVVKAGLMKGRSASRFVPQAHSTRAEAAAVLKGMLQSAGFIDG